MKTILLLASLLAFATVALAENWAILVAGSNGYSNYRHQADVCHAFQIMKENGIPESNIITMMYDDIADNKQNPTPGVIINCPGCPDVYKGVVKDYVGKDVTPTNFLNIIQGKDMTGIGSGKTLRSGPKDDVFIYFSDHGATGLIAFPTQYLYATDLIKALKNMHTNNSYKRLVFYLEACESGSMFNNILPENLNIYVTTAANPYESSYACMYDSKYRAYLTDCYSINWMQNTEDNDIKSYTLQEQFYAIKNKTTQSNVCQYGDTSIADSVLAEFMSNWNSKTSKYRIPATKVHRCNGERVDSRDVNLVYYEKQVAAATTEEEKAHWTSLYEEEKYSRLKSDFIWKSLSAKLYAEQKITLSLEKDASSNADDRCHSKKSTIESLECVRAAVEAAEAQCGKFNDYSLKYVRFLGQACEQGVNHASLTSAVSEICSFVRQ